MLDKTRLTAMGGVTLFLFLPLWAFSSLFLGGELPYFSDFFILCSSNLDFFSTSLAGGELPLWNPLAMGVVPYFADPTTATYYPPQFIFLFFDFPLATRLFIYFHFLIVLFGSYFCARAYGISPLGASFVALSFGLSGYVIYMVNIFTKFKAIVWIPLVFGCFQKSRQSERLKWPLAGGASLAMMVLAGHLYGALFASFFLALETLFRGKEKGLLTVKRVSLLILVGMGLSACQWLPSYLIMDSSSRKSPLNQENQERWHLPPQRLAEFALPGIHGIDPPQNYFPPETKRVLWWSPSLYLGVIPFVLALISLASIPQSRRKISIFFFSIMALLSAFLALGQGGPLGNLLAWIPLVDRFRYPEKFALWITFSLAMLSGFGFDYLRSKNFDSKKRGLSVFLLFGGGFLVGWLLLPSPPLAHPDTPSLTVFFSALWRPAILLLCLFLWSVVEKGSPLLWAVALLGIVAADVTAVNGPSLPTLPERIYQGVPPSLAALPPGDFKDFRISRDPVFYLPRGEINDRSDLARHIDEMRHRWLPNTPHLYGYPTGFSIGSSHLWRYELFHRALKKKKRVLWSQLNVRYLMTGKKREKKEGLELYWKNGAKNQFVYANTTVQPRARIFHKIRFYPHHEGVFQDLGQKEIQDVVSIEDPQKEGVKIYEAPPGEKVEFLHYGQREVILKVVAKAPGYLVLFDSYCPGWKAWRGGEEVEIFPANLTFRAVAIGKGETVIRFRYTPQGMWEGLAISLLTLFSLPFLLYFFKRD